MEDNLVDVSALKKGTADAWEQAWLYLWPVAFRAAWMVLRDEHQVEDVAIQSLEDLNEHIQSIDNLDHLVACLTTISRRSAIDEIRKITAKKRHPVATENIDTVLDEAAWAIPFPPSSLPEGGELSDQQSLIEDLLHSLDLLGNPCRYLLMGHFWDEKTSAELAVELEGNAATIRVRLYRCLNTLRKILRANPLLMKRLEAHLR